MSLSDRAIGGPPTAEAIVCNGYAFRAWCASCAAGRCSVAARGALK